MYTRNTSKIKKITKRPFKGNVYNISVVDDHTYIANGCMVYNCHEMSNRSGQHGDLDIIADIWKNQLPGTELAIGGGNPLAHPGLTVFLKKMREYHIIPNLTVNIMHMKKFASTLREYQMEKMIFGLGISYRGPKSLDLLPEDIDYSNVVFHMIMGIHDLNDCQAVIQWCKERSVVPKILLLGYKTFGNGVQCYTPELQKILDTWREVYLRLLMGNGGIVLSFDNLAISQLELQNQIEKNMWDTLFQGEDGGHTWYIDAVKGEIARTSTSVDRYKYSVGDDIRDLFNKVRV